MLATVSYSNEDPIHIFSSFSCVPSWGQNGNLIPFSHSITSKQLYNFSITGISNPLGTLINMTNMPIYETCVDSPPSLQALPLSSCRKILIQDSLIIKHWLSMLYGGCIEIVKQEESRKLFMWQEKECKSTWIKANMNNICKMGDVLDPLYCSLHYMTTNLVQKV